MASQQGAEAAGDVVGGWTRRRGAEERSGRTQHDALKDSQEAVPQGRILAGAPLRSLALVGC